MSQGKLIVLTGPSGVGKGTLLKLLLAHHPELKLSISATTRSPRPGEVSGEHYYFLDRVSFEDMIDANELLEWAEFAGNFYGTPRERVETALERGESVILEIELFGARQIRQQFSSAFSIFLLPPSLDELEQRLRSRGHDSEESITRRLIRAKAEIEAADEFDLTIVNDDLDKALERIQDALFFSVKC
ncbi:MAG: guanylate kinase [Cyanobacteria bacterium J06627_8]